MKKSAASEKPLKVRFAENLKEIRVGRKLPQEGLAAKSGFSTSYVSMLERGTRAPTLDTIERFASALDVLPLEMLE